MQLRTAALILGIAALAIGLVGCSGGGDAVAPDPATGSLDINVDWPARPARVGTELVPVASNSIQISVYRGTNTNAEPEQDAIINRPSTSAHIEGIGAGQVTVRASAFPLANAGGVAQARADAAATIVAGQTKPLTLTMGSTITGVEVSPDPVTVEQGFQQTMAAASTDANGYIVLTATTDAYTWSVASGSDVITVTDEGVVTATAPGDAVVVATEKESGISGAASVRVPVPVSDDPQFEFDGAWGGQGGANGQFQYPYDLAADAFGSLYVADYGNNRVQEFQIHEVTSSGVRSAQTTGLTFLSKWGGHGTGDGQFSEPSGICVDATGNVYVADTGNSRIQRFSLEPGSGGDVDIIVIGQQVRTRASATMIYSGQWGTHGTANGQFNEPMDVAVDANANAYVVDMDNARVQKFTMSASSAAVGTRALTLAFAAAWGQDGHGAGEFRKATGISVSRDGRLYVADSLNHRIQVFDSGVLIPDDTGDLLASWGVLGGRSGQFDAPRRTAVDAAGRVFVADTYNHRIQVFDADGNYVTQFGSEGTGDGELSQPMGVTLDPLGNVYVADTYNHRIVKFKPIAN